MAKKDSTSSQKKTIKYRLLVYHRLGRRWRPLPFLLIVLTLVLLGMGWLHQQGMLGFGNATLLGMLWAQRQLLIALAILNLMLYLFLAYISRSYVEARPRSLRVRAGLFPLDFSYSRLSQLRLVQFSYQYPPENLRAADYGLLRPYLGYTCTAVDMKSWPVRLPMLRRLWSRYMFTAEGEGLMLLVENALYLNREIDNYFDDYKIRTLGQERRYKDPIERAQEEMRRSRDKGY